jgi:hypothetical protein
MRRSLGVSASILGVSVTILVLALAFVVPAGQVHAKQGGKVRVSSSVHNDVSAPLSSINGKPSSGKHGTADDFPQLATVRHGKPNNLKAPVQTQVGTSAIPTPTNNFDGVGNGFTGPQGTFTVAAAPPDTNGTVGPHDFVQTVNTDFAIFNKDPARGTVGTVRYGPVAINTLWSGFGGLCQTDNDGDPTVVYDRMADRWIISQFAVTNPNPNFFQCVAVSTTGDPTGTWNRYSFSYSNFPDYPKMAVWPDAYYETYNLFNAAGTTFLGAEDCAFNRANMLNGTATTQQCFTTSSSFGGLLPSNLDSATLPPSGSPNFVVGLNTTTSLAFWKFHVDWTTPSNSTFTGPTSIAVASYAQACGGGTCIPQSGTTQQLDSLADRVMYRLAYRNFGDHESLVVNHAITSGSSVGTRWYELRSPNATPTVFQQATYAPDTSYRWMGSVAMDGSGDMALGFSVSSSSLHPGVHYTGRLAGDSLNTMTQGEASIIDGAGSQTGSNLSRWGDYSAMTVDPADDCTFWYTNEYIPSNGAFNWKTRIASFKFPSCGGTPPPNDFSISANPTSLSIAQGGSGTSTISTAVTSGTAGTVNLTASVSPTGPTASLNPTSVTAGGSSTLTVNVGSSVAAGSYTVTVTGTEGTATHNASVAVTVTSAGGGGGITNGGFESGLTGWTTAGVTGTSTTAHSGSASAMVGSASAFNGDSSVSQTFTVPSGSGTLSFWYQVHCTDTVTYDWATATLKDNTTNTTTTPLAKTCTNNGTWVQVSASVTPGHSLTLTLIDHDDGYATDPTYTLYDDVALSAPVTNPVVNGGFESGLTGWTLVGATGTSSTAHTGSASAMVGSASAFNGDSSVSQTFTIPTGATRVTFWYQIHCTDTVTYDWATVTVKDNTTNTTTTPLARTCTNNGTWVQGMATVTAGHSVTITLIDHDDNYPGDPTYTLYDDVAVS